MRKTKRDDIESTIDLLIDHMTYTESKGRVDKSLRFFDGARPLISGLAAEVKSGAQGEFLGGVKMRDLSSPLDQCLFLRRTDYVGCYGIVRLRAVNHHTARSRVRYPRPYMVESSVALFDNTGRFDVSCAYLGSSCDSDSPDDWQIIGPHRSAHITRRLSQIPDDEFMGHFMAAKALQFAEDYDWHVALKYDGFPGVRFPTDADGAREAFRLRDVPPGKSRRAALRHWVREHARLSRRTLSRDIRVRRHLRGVEQFKWNGLSCTITPPSFDVRSEMSQ